MVVKLFSYLNFTFQTGYRNRNMDRYDQGSNEVRVFP